MEWNNKSYFLLIYFMFYDASGLPLKKQRGIIDAQRVNLVGWLPSNEA